MEENMKTQSAMLVKKSEKNNRYSHQLVLFNRNELELLSKIRSSQKTIENIQKIKHLFQGELVAVDNY